MKKIVIAMLGAIMLLASCSKAPKTAAYIPNDAMIVANLNVKQILDKADAKNLDNISFVKMARQELRSENAQISSILDDIIADPTATGLDMREDIIYFMNKDGDGALIVPMYKESKFETFLNDVADKNGLTCTIGDENGFKKADFDIIAVSYNSDVAVIPLNTSNSIQIASLFSLGKENSLTKNKNFAAHWKERSELGFWMDINNLFALAEQFGGSEVLSTTGLPQEYIDEMRKGSFACNLLFDKGAIRLLTTTQGIDNKLIKEYQQDFNDDLMNYMPENCLATIAYAFKIDKMAEMLANSGEIDIDEPISGDKSLKDILPAFGGSFLLDIFDITTNDNGIVPVFALAIDIKDATTVRDLFSSFGLENSGDNYVVPDLGFGKLTTCINDKVLYITNSAESVNQFVAGGYKGSMKAVASRVKKGNYVFVDLNLAHYPLCITSLLPNNIVQMLSQFVDYTDIQMLSNTKAEWVIHLKESKENSLLATLHFIDNNLLELGNLAESLGGVSDALAEAEEDEDYEDFLME